MGIWARLFGRDDKNARGAAVSSNAVDTAKVSEASVSPRPLIKASGSTDSGSKRDDDAVNRVVGSMIARQTAKADGTFETAGKDIKSIVCSDDECPCTDQKQLALGKDAYLYISPGVANFRKDCLSLLELEMKVSRAKSPQDMINAMQNSMPKYVCETGARRRGLDLSAALADGVAAAQTGFVPLRPTPKAQDSKGVKSEAERKDEEQALQMLVSDLLSSERSTREAALVAARQMANKGVRRGVDALEIAIRRKAGADPIEFHTPGLAVMAGADFLKARDTVMDVAKRGTICKEAKQVGSLMAWLELQGGDGVRTLLADIRQAGGEEQMHEFQLVGTHLQAVAGYQRSGANG